MFFKVDAVVADQKNCQPRPQQSHKEIIWEEVGAFTEKVLLVTGAAVLDIQARLASKRANDSSR